MLLNVKYHFIYSLCNLILWCLLMLEYLHMLYVIYMNNTYSYIVNKVIYMCDILIDPILCL